MCTLSLADAIRDGLKPTCDAQGNWTQAPAAAIDGGRRVTSPKASLAIALATIALDDAARVAVEGHKVGEVV